MNDQKPPMIFGKIADCIADVEAVGKNHKNQQQNYAFRSIDDFYDAMQPVLAKHRVFVAPTILEHSREERQTRNGGHVMTTITKVRYKLFAEDGSFIEADALGEGADSGDKSANKAAATAIKYLFMQVFAVRVNGESHDSERDSHEYTPRPNRNPQTTVTEVKETRPAVVQEDSPDWRDFKVPFGKQAGQKLGTLKPDSLEWWITNFEPKPWPANSNNFKPVDLAFRKALNEAGKELQKEAA